MTASASPDLEIIRASLLLESNPTAAARMAGGILANLPTHEAANLLLAAACRRLGDATTAITVLESLSKAHPASPVMQLELGRAQAAGGRNAQALAAFQRAVELDPTLADGWRELASQRFMAGDTLQGDAAYSAYTRLLPVPPELTEAGAALAVERLDAADAVLRQRLAHAPEDVAALRLLADVAARRGDRAAAEQGLLKCLDLAPGYAAARFDLARLLCMQQRIDEALPLIERLLAADPNSPAYRTLKAQSLRFVGRSDESITLMEGVVADRPDDAQAWLSFGNLLREVGDQARAVQAYRRSIAARPGFGEAHWALANLKTVSFTQEERQTMQRDLADSPMLGSSRTHLEFALGRALEDAGQYAASFEHYVRGNDRHRATQDYEHAVTTADMQRTKSVYTPAFFAGRPDYGSGREDPIFIVGLPRSGSTLLEQILASHTQVEGTRELPDVPAMALELAAQRGPDDRLEYPQQVASLTKADIDGLAARYLAQTLVHRPLGRPRFVDKMLGNFNHIGLIHLMFPRASIIDARRHPLGCGFSCYKQMFVSGLTFTYDLDEMGRYYRDYVGLMDHMDTVLPGRVHRLHYEHLVADPEREVRRLLEYCGLPFEEQCLRFYDTRRVVQTVSSEQVRRPIYGDSVDHWRHYEPWLRPLKDALGDLIERYPSVKSAR